MPDEYGFEIDEFTPSTLPMARLNAYISDLVELLGNQDHVHLITVREASAMPIILVDNPAITKVEKRLFSVRAKSGSNKAIKAYESIDAKLSEDNTSGRLIRHGLNVLEFPGRNREMAVPIHSVRQESTVDGEVIQVGGRDETISVYVRSDEEIYICTATREQGRQMARYLFDGRVRIHGNGSWSRLADDTWKLNRLVVDSFIPLERLDLQGAIEKLWSQAPQTVLAVDDPMAFMGEIRDRELDFLERPQ